MHYGKSCQIYILEQYQATMITMDVENGHLLCVGEEICTQIFIVCRTHMSLQTVLYPCH